MCGRNDDESVFHLAMVEELASMQLASTKHKKTLLEAGCPLLGPDELIEELDDWMDDEELWKNMEELKSHFQERLPQVKKYFLELKDYKIPLTLTHGDFSLRNVGFQKDQSGEERMIFFDWQNTAIWHPFFEFHELKLGLTEAERDAYLRQWTMFEPLERCRELCDIGQLLGWLLRVRAKVNCFRTAKLRYCSASAMEFGDFVNTLT